MPEAPELDEAINDWWQAMDPPGGMVTGWVLIAEGLGSEGGRSLVYAWSEDLKGWQLKGYLHDMLDSQLAGETADQVLDQ